MAKFLILICVSILTVSAHAAKLYDIEMPDVMTVEGSTLTLNGQGIRKVEKFGIPFKVYVGGLYIPKKSSDPEEIHRMAGVKVVDMVFLRRVSKADLEEGMKLSFSNNCFKEDCEATKPQMAELGGKLVDMLDKSKMQLRFFPDRVEAVIHGRSDVTATVKGDKFSKNLLNAYFGPKPPNPELKDGLLGIAKK